MKRLAMILAAVLLAVSTSAFADIDYRTIGSAGWDKLSPDQQAQILQQVTEAAKQKTESPSLSPDSVSKWVDVGAKIGQMMGGAAKELGIQVNDFVKTPVGKWTMAIIVWKYMGAALTHLFVGMIVLVIGLGVMYTLMRRSQRVEIAYNTEVRDLFGRSTRKTYSRSRLDGDEQFMYGLGYLIVIVASMIVTFAFG